MKIIHIAPFNTAGVPMAFVKEERAMGHDSRLVTLGRDEQSRDVDICLDLPFVDSSAVRILKSLVSPKARRTVNNRLAKPDVIPLVFQPGNAVEASLFNLRERLWTSRIDEAIEAYGLDDCDAVQLDGGLGFYRDGRIIRRWKSEGKKVICCYTGSDLRTRGVIAGIDAVSDLNVTVEIDHLKLHPEIHHVPFPLDLAAFSEIEISASEKAPLYIGHAPTNRLAKGSDSIIEGVRNLEKRYPVKLMLIEGLPYHEAIALKSRCQLFVDQLGELGYGMNGVESLALGIPTCTSLAAGFSDLYPDHPFIEINSRNLESRLVKLIEDEAFRFQIAEKSRKWVKKTHDSAAAVRRIHQLAGL